MDPPLWRNQGHQGPDLAAHRRVFDEAVEAGCFVDYQGGRELASVIEDAIDSVERPLKGEHASQVIQLAEHALKAVEEAMGSVDDSDGRMGSILGRLQELHLKAFRKARPDPEELARRPIAWALRTGRDTFFGAAGTFAGVLGKKELAVYRKPAEAEWARVPSLSPGRDDGGRYGRRLRITHIMETPARRTGAVEAVAAIRKSDLSTAWACLRIAGEYKEGGKPDLVLECAEPGVKAFPERTDARLREILAGEYSLRKRHNDAMGLVRAGFAATPAKAGACSTWRPKALDHLRRSVAKATREARGDRRGSPWRADHTQLVRVLRWEKDVEAGWREAGEGGCSDELWLELAAKRETIHPQDALSVYQRQIEPALRGKSDVAYR